MSSSNGNLIGPSTMQGLTQMSHPPPPTHTHRCPEMLLHGEAVLVDMALSAEMAHGL
jgi:hypothetical protein